MELMGVWDPAFPEDYIPREFTGVTVQQLLEEWEQRTVGPPITTRLEDPAIVRDAKRPWRDRLLGWWERNKPSWLR